MDPECSCRPAAGLQQCLLPSAGRHFWTIHLWIRFAQGSSTATSHRDSLSLLRENAYDFFSPQSSPVFKLGTLLASPTLRGTDPPAKHCPFLSFIMLVLTPERPHSMKNVPSGLWLTLPLSWKHFLSTTLKLLPQQSRPPLFAPVSCSLSALLQNSGSSLPLLSPQNNKNRSRLMPERSKSVQQVIIPKASPKSQRNSQGGFS